MRQRHGGSASSANFFEEIMGKSIALFFASAALVILAGSFMAPHTDAADKNRCAPAYGVDPCAVTGAIPAH